MRNDTSEKVAEKGGKQGVSAKLKGLVGEREEEEERETYEFVFV